MSEPFADTSLFKIALGPEPTLSSDPWISGLERFFRADLQQFLSCWHPDFRWQIAAEKLAEIQAITAAAEAINPAKRVTGADWPPSELLPSIGILVLQVRSDLYA